MRAFLHKPNLHYAHNIRAFAVFELFPSQVPLVLFDYPILALDRQTWLERSGWQAVRWERSARDALLFRAATILVRFWAVQRTLHAQDSNL